MKYCFNVKITDKDYMDFNYFHLFKSHYAKKQFQTARVVLSFLPLILWFASYALNGFSDEHFVTLVAYIPLSVILFFTIKPFNKFIVKHQLRSTFRKGKKPYAPDSVMEFYEDMFVEITPENRSQVNYSAVDSVYVVKGEIVYIYLNSAMAHLIPYSVFESENQFNSFIEFIGNKTKPVIYSL